MKSDETRKFKYDKSVYTAAIGTCGACYDCANVCPENAIIEWNPPTINHDKCTRCLKCIEICPRNVLRMIH